MSSGPQKLDRAGLEAMLHALRPRLHRYCARMAGSVIDGEDIVQDAVLKALGALDGVVAVEKPENWLFRIAHNAAQDYLRRRARENLRIGEADMTPIEDPTSSADSRYVAGLGLRTFMHLTLAQRSAVILVDVLGLSLHETCDVTGASLAATKAALHRGREQLRSLATETETPVELKLDREEERRLRQYIELFNARDFDGVRDLIAEDIRVDVVNRTRLDGKAKASNYFGNYSRAEDWSLSLGFFEGRPAILSRNPVSREVTGFMLLEWREGKVVGIRDFRYAPYCLADAEVRGFERRTSSRAVTSPVAAPPRRAG